MTPKYKFGDKVITYKQLKGEAPRYGVVISVINETDPLYDGLVQFYVVEHKSGSKYGYYENEIHEATSLSQILFQ